MTIWRGALKSLLALLTGKTWSCLRSQSKELNRRSRTECYRARLSATWRQISALLLLFLMPLLSGCAQQQKPPVEYRVIKQPVLNLPVELTSRIDVPDLPDKPSYGDSVSMNATLYGIVGQCNYDRAAIRKLQVTDKEPHP